MMTEPRIDLRKMGAELFQFYRAWVMAGFTEEQAFELAKTVLEQGVRNEGGNE